jgi:hypothetical protein
LSEEPRNPNLTDYMAGTMLANGFVWIWSMIHTYFPDLISRIPIVIQAVIAYAIYISGSAVSSYLVCKRTSSNHLMVGLKLAGLAWLFSLILMLSSTTGPTLGTAMMLLVCYLAGGLAGAYMALRSELRPRRADRARETPE